MATIYTGTVGQLLENDELMGELRRLETRLDLPDDLTDGEISRLIVATTDEMREKANLIEALARMQVARRAR